MRRAGQSHAGKLALGLLLSACSQTATRPAGQSSPAGSAAASGSAGTLAAVSGAAGVGITSAGTAGGGIASGNPAEPNPDGGSASGRGAAGSDGAAAGRPAARDGSPPGRGAAGTDGGRAAAGPSGSAGTQPTAAGQAGGPAASPGSPATAAVGCEGLDPLQTLRGLAPTDPDLAEDFMGYLSDLGPLTCAAAGTGTARTITQTIFVPPNSVYDGRGEKLTADSAMLRCDTSEGEQAEDQRPYFVLAKGATLKNVTITYPGCEGVHMLGDNVLDNVRWEDVGEDAASVRSYFPGGRITILNSEAHKAKDKTFQFNAPCDVRIERFTGSDMGKLVRQNGGEEFELKIDLNTVQVTGVISAVVQSDSPRCFIRHHALSYMFQGSGDKSDRVFRDIPPANVTEY